MPLEPASTTTILDGKTSPLPAELRPWIGRQYGWSDRGLRPIAQPRAGLIYLTVRDPREGLQAARINTIRQDGATVVSWLTGSTVGHDEALFSAPLWWPIGYEPRAPAAAPIQASLFAPPPTAPRQRQIELVPVTDKRQLTLLGTGAAPIPWLYGLDRLQAQVGEYTVEVYPTRPRQAYTYRISSGRQRWQGKEFLDFGKARKAAEREISRRLKTSETRGAISQGPSEKTDLEHVMIRDGVAYVRFLWKPGTASGNRKGWGKVITGIDRSQRGGYAIDGPFMTPGAQEMPAGSIFVDMDPSGSTKNQEKLYNLAVVDPIKAKDGDFYYTIAGRRQVDAAFLDVVETALANASRVQSTTLAATHPTPVAVDQQDTPYSLSESIERDMIELHHGPDPGSRAPTTKASRKQSAPRAPLPYADQVTAWRGAMTRYLGILKRGKPSADAVAEFWAASQALAAAYGLDLSAWAFDQRTATEADRWWVEAAHTSGPSAIVDVLAAEARAAATKLGQLDRGGRLDQASILAWIVVVIKLLQAAERVPGLELYEPPQTHVDRWTDSPEYSSTFNGDATIELRAFPEGDDFGWVVLNRDMVIHDRGYGKRSLKAAKTAAIKALAKLETPKKTLRRGKISDPCDPPRSRKGDDAACRGDWDGIVSCVVRSGGLDVDAPEVSELVHAAGDRKHVPPRLLRKGGKPWYVLASILTDEGFVPRDEHDRPDEAAALERLVDALRGGPVEADPRLNDCVLRRVEENMMREHERDQDPETGGRLNDRARIERLMGKSRAFQMATTRPPGFVDCARDLARIATRFDATGRLEPADRKRLKELETKCERFEEESIMRHDTGSIRKTLKIDGKKMLVTFASDLSSFSFAGEEFFSTPHGEQGAHPVLPTSHYGYTHGGDAYRAAVDLAHKLGHGKKTTGASQHYMDRSKFTDHGHLSLAWLQKLGAVLETAPRHFEYGGMSQANGVWLDDIMVGEWIGGDDVRPSGASDSVIRRTLKKHEGKTTGARKQTRNTQTGASTRPTQSRPTQREIDRAIEKATRDLPPGEYEIVLN